MEVGLRVVRGPNWILDDVESDGGEGFVGTVVEVGGSRFSSLPENLVWVQWDSGIRHDHRAGYYGAYDLCVLDSAPIGIKHEGIQCESCKENPILGMCWKCADCPTHCNLCTSCYMADEHSKQHAFQRVDFPDEAGIPVGTRLGATKIQSKGIFPGAKVVRGVDWHWKDQDGGDGNEGVVIEFRNWKKSPKRGVLVSWDCAKKNTYRLGAKGKIDLKCVTPGTGVIYYKEHLPKVGEWKHKLGRKEAGASAMASAMVSESQESAKSDESKPGVGDLVCVSLPPDIVKAMNSNIEEWTDSNNRYLGKTGTVQSITSSGGVRILYNNNRILTFHPDLVAKENKDTGDRTAVSACSFRRGAAVRITGEAESLRRLQQGHGPWNDAVRRTTGKNGRVLDMTPAGDVEVAVMEDGEENVIVFNAAALSLITDGSSPNTRRSQVNFKQDAGQTRETLLGDLFQSEEAMGRFLSAAAAAGNVEVVENFLNSYPHLVNYSDDATHPPLIRACQEGNSHMVSFLLTRNADINQQDSQGYRALHHAANRDMSGSTASVLVLFGANLNDTQNQALSSPLHLTAKERNPETMGVLIKAGCEVNLADSQGFTPLHYAANGDFTGATALLLVENGADVNNTHNDGGLGPLHVAVNEFNRDVVEILIQAGCDVNLKDKQGLTAIHLAAKRDVSGDIAGLLIGAGADLNINTNQGMFTPLHIAVIEQNVQTVGALVQAGCDRNIKSHDGNTALHEVSRHGNVLVAETLLDSPALPDLDIRNQQGLTSFLFVLIKGYRDVAKRIYQKCPSVATIPAYGGTTALHLAALYDDEEILRLILDSGLVKMHSRNKDGLTALDLAKAVNHSAAIRLLTSWVDNMKELSTDLISRHRQSGGSQLERCEVERHDFRFGDTVQVRERREVVELMQLGHGGWNSSMTQALGKMGIVEDVLDTGDVRVTVQQFLHPFAVPLVFNPLALIRPGLKDTSQPAAEATMIDNLATGSDKDEFTLLDPLVEYAFVSDSYLELIPEHSDELQDLNQGSAGEMLFVACLMRWFIKVQEVISLHPKAVSQGESDRFLLHVCCFTGDFELVKILLDAGADVTLPDHNKFTPLHTAAMGDRIGDAMNLLLEKGANPNDNDNKFGVSPLHLAVARNNEAAVKALTQRGDIQINLQDLEGDTAFHVACTLGRDEIVEMMLTVDGINTGLFNRKGYLPLHLAAKKGQAKIVKTLLKLDNSQVNTLTSNEDAMASIHFASNNGDEEIVKVLLSTELCDFDIRNGEGRTPLDLADVAHNENVIALLKHQIEPVKTELAECKTVEEGISCLEDVSKESTPFRTGDVVRIQTNEQLIDRPQSSHDSSGEIAQVVSAGSDVAVFLKGEVVTFKPSELVLVDRESEHKPGDQTRIGEPEEIPPKVFRKLVRAVFKDDLPTFVAILTSWPHEINRFFNGTTLLHLASGDGFPRVLRKLIELGANLMAQDRRGLTPLHIAAARDRTGIGASILLEKLADPNFQSSRSNNRTALHFAVLCNNAEVAKQLIGSQCDVNRKDGRGNTPLHLAIECGNEHIAELITEAEMYDPLSRNSEGLMGLHQAVIRRNKYILKKLLVRSPSVVNEPTPEGDRPIHLAAAKGFDEIAQLLIDEGQCKLDVRNRSKKYPHNVAQSSGHEDLARRLWDEYDRLFGGMRHSGEPTPESDEMRTEAVHGSEAERLQSSTPFEDDEIPDRLLCCICFEKQKNITFQCGHLNTCWDCAHRIKECPECKAFIKSRLTTYY